MELEDTDKLVQGCLLLEKGIFECLLCIKQLLQQNMKDTISPSPSGDSTGVKLPKLDVYLCMTALASQMLRKLVYLRQALKDGTAKHTIEELSRSGEHALSRSTYFKV